MTGTCNTLVVVHNHPAGTLSSFSHTDTRSELELCQEMKRLAYEHRQDAPAFFLVEILLGPEGFLAARTRCTTNPQNAVPAVLRVIGHTYRALISGTSADTERTVSEIDAELYSRQEDFIVPDVQKHMQGARVLQIGAGGTGSIMAEALTRLGIGHLRILDFDKVEKSNLNRLQGFSVNDIGCSKAICLAKRLAACNPAASIAFSDLNIIEAVNDTSLFTNADMIVSCVDNDVARHYITCAAAQYMLPVFDCSSIVRQEKYGWGFYSRCYHFIPGMTACPTCLEGIRLTDGKEVAEHFANPLLRREKRRAGYVENHTYSAPSVYPVNMQSVAMTMLEIMHYFTGARPLVMAAEHCMQTGDTTRHEFEKTRHRHREGCPVCDRRSGKGGALPISQIAEGGDSFEEILVQTFQAAGT
jgi:molybdopterin/thiamine biosynthesis adenylyltransferase